MSKLQEIIPQNLKHYLMNMFSIINVNFRNHWTANVQMAVAQKLCVQKPIVMDTI